MTTALDLIQAGYASSTANDAGRLATDSEMLGELTRWFQAYYALWCQASADDSLTSGSFTFSGVPAEITLPIDTIDVDRLELGVIGGPKINLIPVAEKERAFHLAPAVYRQGLSLRSRGQTGDPVAGTVAILYYDDPPAALTALTSVIDVRFPVRFHELLVLRLALYLDQKDVDRDPQGHAKLVEAFQAIEGVFKAVAGLSDTGKDESTNPRGQV